MEPSEGVPQQHAEVELALTELNRAHEALDEAEAALDNDVRQNRLSMSRRAHTLAMHYLACSEASEEERQALQVLLRWLEVRLERISRKDSGHTAAA